MINPLSTSSVFSFFKRSKRSKANAKENVRRARVLSLETLEPRVVLASGVYISEFLASNSGGLNDGDGSSPDWVELFNSNATTVDLGGYHLTDDSSELNKWAFPSGTTIAPGASLVVFASDKGASGPSGELHTTFKLSTNGEYLGLIEPDGITVVHEYAPEYPSQQTNISYGLSMDTSELTLVDDSTAMRYTVPSNGSADNTWHTLGFNDNSWSQATAGLGYAPEQGGNDPYLFLIDASLPGGTTSAYTRFEFNLSDPASIDTLSLEMLYDDGFVAYLNGTLIEDANAPASPAWNSAAGPINRPDPTVLDAYVQYDVSDHTDLLVSGTNILAIHALNQVSSSDMLMIPRLIAGTANIATPLVAGYFTEPTPGAPNGSTLLGVVADTQFSIDRGFFSEPFDVEITTDTLGALILYTTDGSEPAVDDNLAIVNGLPYSGPVTISGTTNLRAAAFKLGYAPTNTDTQTYLYTSDIITQTHQSAIAAGYPAFWGSRPADYGLDPDVIGPGDLFGGVYASEIEDSLKAIPSISLTLETDDFFGPSGIYSNPQGSGISWERATSAELIYPDGSDGFQIDAGLRIHGGASRALTKKHSMRLLFKSEYGDSKLKYPLFGEEGVDEFDTIVLRPHFNDGWGWGGENADVESSFIRDRWFRDMQAAMGHASSRGNLVHLYINGQYWGMYNPSERPDDSFAAETFGGDKSEYDVVNHNGLHKGTLDAYNTMIGIAEDVSNGATEAIRTQAYLQIQGKLADGTVDPNGEAWLDVVNYIDYMLLNHYGGNNDWPTNNWFANRRIGTESDGFRFYAWDSEIALSLSNRTSLFENNLGQNTGAAEAYGKLIASEEFRLAFADRVHEHLFNGGVLYVNPSNQAYDPLSPQDNLPASRYADLAETVYDSLVAESARWGDQHASSPLTRNNEWQTSLNYMLGEYFRDRHDIILSQWENNGLYPQTAAPEFLIDQVRQHGGEVSDSSDLDFENPNTGNQGTIYFTTDGTDPRLIGGAINTTSASEYISSINLPAGVTQVKARVLHNGVWSALTQASFSLPVPIVDNADFNEDGTVNLADYTVWRDNLGAVGDPGIAGDANNDGTVDSDDYQVWRSQFGTSPATQVASSQSTKSLNAGSKESAGNDSSKSIASPVAASLVTTNPTTANPTATNSKLASGGPSGLFTSPASYHAFKSTSIFAGSVSAGHQTATKPEFLVTDSSVEDTATSDRSASQHGSDTEAIKSAVWTLEEQNYSLSELDSVFSNWNTDPFDWESY